MIKDGEKLGNENGSSGTPLMRQYGEIKSKYPENTLAVFVQPPSLEELEKRLLERSTESKEKIQTSVNQVFNAVQNAN